MEDLIKLRSMVYDKIHELAEDDTISSGNIEMIDYLTHSLKSIDSVLVMERGNAVHESEKSRMSRKLRTLMGEAETDECKAMLSGLIDKMNE